MKFYTKRTVRLALFLFLSVFLVSCAEEIENRGYVTKFSDFSKLNTGKSTKMDVIEALGSPTTTSDIGGENWIYLGVEETKETFFDPEIKSYDAYILSFNKNGVLNEVKKKDKSSLKEMAVAKEYTETGGNEVGFFQQLLGNLGKFNPNSAGRRR